MATNITREELKAKMDRGEEFVLVDALSAKHYDSSHLPGAINLPYEFVDEAETVLPDKRRRHILSKIQNTLNSGLAPCSLKAVSSD